MDDAPVFGLNQKTHAVLKDVFQKYTAIEQVIIYGSRAKGNFKPSSDIDLTLVAPSMSHELLLKLENEIDDLLLPYKFDISLFHQIDNADLIDHIKRVGKTFYVGG